MLLSLLLALLLTSLLLLAIWGFKKMAVNLSPVGGVAGQFFDNNGNPLVGGKLFTYAAGTTTPQATFTSSTGVTPNSNPIILNGGGRVPAEIWLTDGLAYKFVLYSSTDQLIGSWDNIVGINSNFVNFVTSEEVQTATAGQTVFTLTTMQYAPGTNNLVVYVDGVNQIEGGSFSFVETNSTTVTFTTGLHVGALVKFVSAETLSTGISSATNVIFTGFNGQTGVVQDIADNDGSDWIGFEPAGSGAVARSAQDKLRETVSVKDFGAVGDGVTDDTAAIQAAIDYVATIGGGVVYLPSGTYAVGKTTAPYNPAIAGSFDRDVIIDIQSDNITLKGSGRGATVLANTITNTTSSRFIKIGRRVDGDNFVDNVSVQDMTLLGNYTGTVTGFNTNTGIDVSGRAGTGCTNIKLERLEIKNCAGYGIGFQRDGFINCLVSDVQIDTTSGDGIDFKMDTNNSGYGNLIENVTVLRFGLGVVALGVPQAGVNIRTGVSARDIYVAEYGAENTGLRVDTSLDTTVAQQSAVDNVRCISTGGTNSKGFQFTGFGGRYSNLYTEGAEIGYWVRTRKAQYSNIAVVDCNTGVYIFANPGDARNDNVFVNVYASGSASGGAGIRVSGSGADLVGNTFVNPVTENNTGNDVLIGSGVLYTKFIGGSITAGKVSDSGTGTQFVGCGAVAGPAQFGRNRTQYVEISGDGSANLIKGVSVSGAGKQFVLQADANSEDLVLSVQNPSGRVRLGPHTANADAPVVGYIEVKDSAGALRRLAVIA
jgi:hypothetical protein